MRTFEPGFLDEPRTAAGSATASGSGAAAMAQGASLISPSPDQAAAPVAAEQLAAGFAPGFVAAAVPPSSDPLPPAWDPGLVEAAPVARVHGTGALTWVAGGLCGLLVGGAALVMAGFAADQMARSPLLGAATLALYAATLGALGWGIALELRAYHRLAAVDGLRRLLLDPACPADAARRASRAWLEGVARHLPHAAAARAALDACTNADEVRATLRHLVLEPLRERARCLGQRAGLQGAALVAVTPSAALDGLVAGLRALALIREVAGLYGLRPGASVTVGLVRRAAWTAAGVSGVDLVATALAEQLLNHAPVLKHLAGAAPGAGLTARRLYRLALATAEACAPLPLRE